MKSQIRGFENVLVPNKDLLKANWVHTCGQKLKLKKGTVLVFVIDSVPCTICPTCGKLLEFEDVNIPKLKKMLGDPV